MKSLARLEGMFALLDKRGVPFESVVDKVQQENAQSTYQSANGEDRIAQLRGTSTRSASIDNGSPLIRSESSAVGLTDSPVTDPDIDVESETDGVTKSLGIMKVDHERNKTFYVGDGYWAAFLNDISVVKNYFGDPDRKREIEAHINKVVEDRKRIQNAGSGIADAVGGFTLLFGATVPPSLGEILSRIPSRQICDTLIDRYHATIGLVAHVLHQSSFKRQYERFWNEMDLRRDVIGTTAGTSVSWLGMLFAMMRLACLSYFKTPDQMPEILQGRGPQLPSQLRQSVCDCLTKEDFARAGNAFVIETLIFHQHAEYTSNRDTDPNVGHLSNLIVRIAMKMGYHRDSKFWPELSPFQGEMRRRVWTWVRTCDILFSQQAVLPPMVRYGDSDTELPRNINDSDFDEDSRALPPERPNSEITDISYLIHKGKLAYSMGRIVEELLESNKRFGYDQVLRVDRRLREIYNDIPVALKITDMQNESEKMFSQRYSLATLHHKALCMLHRRYATAKPFNRYPHSRKRTVARSRLDHKIEILRS
ncbi:hypothetical protein LTR66_017541 [Elasticomyces elasticus]|nr:hypothetical protein LTR66_017541 [Elasticomyces elasticus]